ncbi:MAG: integrase core domain-containing protein [Myxococcota bacterium]
MLLRWILVVTLVWVLGVVDFQSSRLSAVRPTGAAIVSALERVFRVEGTPGVIVTDNGGQFLSADFREGLRRAGVKHRRIRPGHPWTNGRVERLFRTFKELQRFYAPVLVSLAHLEAVCRDFSVFYNHCRPHTSFEGRTPAEVDRGLAHQPVLGRAVLFDGQLYAYRFT